MSNDMMSETLDIIVIDGIGPVHGQSLKEIGVKTVEDFVAVAQSPDDLEALASRIQVATNVMSKWYEQAVMLVQNPALVAVNMNKQAEQVRELMARLYWKPLQRFQKHVIRSTFLFLALASTLHGVILLCWGGFAGTPDFRDFVQDMLYLPVQIVQGIAVYYYLKLPNLLESTIADLNRNHIFKSSDLQIEDHVRRLFGYKLLQWIPFIVGISACCLFVVYVTLFVPQDVWWSQNIFTLIIMALALAPAWISGVGILVNVILATILTNHIFRRNEIVVHPLHPDRSGGFSPLGRYSLKLSYFALGVGAIVASLAYDSYSRGVLGQDFVVLIEIALYIVGIPILFFLPLRSAHLAMVKFRSDLIRETSQRYLRENLKAHLGSQQDSEKLQKRLEYMEALQKLESHERAYPVWPLNIGIGVNLLGTTLLPILPTLIGILIDLA